MLGNIIMLSILIIIMYIITKSELGLIQGRFEEGRTDFKDNLLKCCFFWKNLLKKRARFVAVIVILACQKGLVGMIISVVLINCIAYYLAKNNTLEINWESKAVQNIATFLTVSLAVIWVLTAIF